MVGPAVSRLLHSKRQRCSLKWLLSGSFAVPTQAGKASVQQRCAGGTLDFDNETDAPVRQAGRADRCLASQPGSACNSYELDLKGAGKQDRLPAPTGKRQRPPVSPEWKGPRSPRSRGKQREGIASKTPHEGYWLFCLSLRTSGAMVEHAKCGRPHMWYGI